MNNREKRRKIAEDTLDILKKGVYQNSKGKLIDVQSTQQKAEEGTIIYSPSETDKLLKERKKLTRDKKTKIVVVSQTTLDAVRELIKTGCKNVLCLNFASAKNPGGGFLGGSQAQEESIARATGLYNCQISARDYYDTNRKIKSCVYTDYMIYSPSVPIIKFENGDNLEELMFCGIITAPAVNMGVVRNREPHRVKEVEEIMKRRIQKVLAIALGNNHRNIVLGAWGCGVFQNDPKDIANYFYQVIEQEFKNEFDNIVFAIYSRNEKFIRPFRDIFEKNQLNNL